MAKRTTYNVDLTVEEVANSGAGGKHQQQGPDNKARSNEQQTTSGAQQGGSPDSQSTSPQKGVQTPAKSEGAAPKPGGSPGDGKAADMGKPKKDKRKEKKKKHTDSGSSSSSSSSDSSDEDTYQSAGVRRALEPWRYPLYSPSASYRQLDVLAGSHQYTISGFSLARAMGCGTRLCSDFFEVAGQAFRLEVYPAGFTADTRKYISVFLTTPGSVNPNHVLYELAVLDQSGKDKHIAASRSVRGERNGPLLAYCRGIVAAVPKLAKVKVLEEKAKRYLLNDMLVIRATVHVLRGWSSVPALHTHMGSVMGGAGGSYPMVGGGTYPLAPSSAQAVCVPQPAAASAMHYMPLGSLGSRGMPQPTSQHILQPTVAPAVVLQPTAVSSAPVLATPQVPAHASHAAMYSPLSQSSNAMGSTGAGTGYASSMHTSATATAPQPVLLATTSTQYSSPTHHQPSSQHVPLQLASLTLSPGGGMAGGSPAATLLPTSHGGYMMYSYSPGYGPVTASV